LARKILLADDSVTAQNMGRKILADAGYEVIAVNNGSAALKKIAELKPDLVILDVYMPGYSGLEVCQRLKESPETARIPVLLTVGKLEPFKPEEAQRVRAEGFIVKPFEASELLGTLSKMEDKVVPRAEPSKPGRFARAIAAAEESGRGGRNETNSAENGWKSRIGFPKQKAEPEEKIADEALTSAGKASEKKEETRQAADKPSETSLDVAALAPAGLPKDVTPEEVAAIAAAAAQMQMVVSAIKQEHQASAADTSLQPAPDRAEGNLPSPPEASRDTALAMEKEGKTEAPVEGKKEESKKEESKLDGAAGETAAAEVYHRRHDDVKPEEVQDVPVTMAATAESAVAGGSRWTAVSVALEGSEAALSLDQEMQKAYAAVASAGSAGATVRQVEPTSAGNSSEHAPAAVELPATISNPKANPPEPASASSQQSDAGAAPITAEVAPGKASAEPSPTVEFAKPNQEPAPVREAVRPETDVAEPAASSSSAFAPIVARAEDVTEPKPDSETVKNTAAAWESWRQVHDTSHENEVAKTQPKEPDLPESVAAETAARAVAAGAEQALREAAAAAPEGDQNNVASIVDSVLADLRPKLMEEINRKMSKKK